MKHHSQADDLRASFKVPEWRVFCHTAFVDEATSAAAITPLLQHRIRGTLNAAGFESTGRKFSAGDYKGMTKFALVHREAR